MEITRRFHEFLADAESHSDQSYLRPDLVEELTKIKQLLLKLPSLDSNSQNGKIQNGSNSLEKSLFSPLKALNDGVNECLNQIRLLSLHTLNHKLSISTITRYLKVYFSAIFRCHSISIISEASAFEGHFRRLNKQDIKDESVLRSIISEVQKTFSKGANHSWIELSKSPTVGNFYPDFKDEKVLVLRFVTQEKDQVFAFLEGVETNAGIAEKFFEHSLHNDFQALLEVVPRVISQALMPKNKQEGNKHQLVGFLESIKLEYLDMLRSIFLRHLRQEFVKHFDADVTIELEGATVSHSNDKTNESKRKLSIIVRSYSRVEFKANFSFDLIGIAEDVSTLWGDISHLYKKFQERMFNRLQRKYENQNQNIIALEFDKERKLCYQNQEIPDQLRPYIDIQNFVSLPTTLSYKIVLGKNALLFLKIEEALEAISQNKRILAVNSLKLDNILVEILVKKSASNSTKINGFTVMFYLSNPTDERKKKLLIDKEIDKLIADLSQGDNKLKGDQTLWDGFREKMERLSNIRKFEEGEKDLFSVALPKADKTKASVLNEYMRDEEVQSLSKGISTKFESHLAGVVEKMVKSNFLMISESPKSKKKNRPASSIGSIDSNAGGNDLKNPFSITLADEKIDKSLLIQCEDDDKHMEEWSFNFTAISDLEKSRLAWWMLDDLNLITEYNIPLPTLCEFMNQIRAGYTRFKNPFHNYNHSLTVMHATYYMLKHAGYKKNFSSLIQLGMLIAAYCHDVDHRGHNNAFEVASKSQVAILYHDKSVLENHHAAVTFNILVKPATNIFSNLSGDQWRDIRKLIISCILATDMKEHFDMIAKLQALIDKSNKPEDESPKKNITWSDEDLMLVTGYMIHCADLSGPSKDFDLAYYWATKVNAEFTAQVEEEKKLGLPVTPYMLNLDKPDVLAKGEMQFMKFIIKPVWLKLNEFTLDAMKIASDNIEKNIQRWEEKYNEAIGKTEESKANNP